MCLSATFGRISKINRVHRNIMIDNIPKFDSSRHLGYGHRISITDPFEVVSFNFDTVNVSLNFDTISSGNIQNS